jgi:uncharacterized protein YbjT (DUF2867 family)
MFTILGASGNTGSVVASTLLDRGEKVRLLVRDPAKVAALTSRGAEVVKGDVLDQAAIESALDGARGAYLLLPPDNASPDLLARNRKLADLYAAAVISRRTPHVALLSSVAAHEPAGTGPIVSVHAAEQALLRATGTKLTFVRAAYFIENILGFAHPMKADGVLPVFGGGADHRFPMVATADIGRVAAEALLAPPAKNDVIELAGPAEQSFDDAARIASGVLGRDVKTVALPIEGMVPALQGLGFSANVAGLYREMTEALGKGLVKWDGTGRAVRGTVTLEQVLRVALG